MPDTAQYMYMYIPCYIITYISRYVVTCLQLQRCVYSTQVTYKSYTQQVGCTHNACTGAFPLTYIIMMVPLFSHSLQMDVCSPTQALKVPERQQEGDGMRMSIGLLHRIIIEETVHYDEIDLFQSDFHRR